MLVLLLQQTIIVEAQTTLCEVNLPASNCV